jgi:hypothetical protein
LALGSLLVVGCGSTLQESRYAADTGGQGLAPVGGIAPTAPAPVVEAPTLAPPPVTIDPGGASGPTAVPTQAVSTAAPVQPTVSESVGGPTLKGVTAKTITVGIQTFEGFAKAGKALGVSAGLPTSETPENARRVIDYINKHGGIAGRKVVPVFNDTNIESANSFDSSAQAACSRFTEDNKVFAVVTPEIFDHDTLMSCLAQHQTPALINSVNIYDQIYANRYPGLFYGTTSVFGDRWAAFIDAIVAKNYLPKAAKIGIVRGTWPEDQRTTQILINRLKSHGLSVVDTVSVDDEVSTPDVAHVLSTMLSIQLRFRAKGITHVIFEKGPVFPYGFMVAAQSQGYHPHYLLTSQANLDFLQSNASSEQTRNAAGVTFTGLPSHHLENSATRLCHKIGPDVGSYCGPLLLLKAAADKAPALTVQGLAAGFKALGKKFVSPQTIATDFAAHYQNGGAAMRTFAWDGAHHSFNYTGGIQRVP